MSITSICDICKEMTVLLSKFDESNSVEDEDAILIKKNDLNILINYINIWNQKRCACFFKDAKNFTRFNNLVQSIIVTSFNLLNNVLRSINESEDFWDESPFRDWDNQDKEKLLHLKSKVFQVNFPLYVVFRNSNIAKMDELSQKEIKIATMYCDPPEYEVPIYLMRKIIYFIEADGLALYLNCFKEANLSTLPILFAHSMISVIQNIKHYLNLSLVNHILVQLRTYVINFLCKMQDDDLRVMNNRAMFEYIWSVVREYNNPNNFGIDKDGLRIALKYFTSSTLTMRLSGLAQINNYISIYNDLQHATSNLNVELVGNELNQWIIDNKIIENIFGPNSHVEVIKQSHFILSFIASKVGIDHIDIIWTSAQLKHYERYIFEILSQLIKKFKLKPVLYLYKLLWKIKPKDHSEHTLNLASQIIKYIWSYNGVQPDMITNFQYIPNDKTLCDETALNKNTMFAFFKEPKTSSSSASSIEVSEDEEEFDIDLNTQHICSALEKNEINKMNSEESSNTSSESDIDVEFNEITPPKVEMLNNDYDKTKQSNIQSLSELKEINIDFEMENGKESLEYINITKIECDNDIFSNSMVDLSKPSMEEVKNPHFSKNTCPDIEFDSINEDDKSNKKVDKEKKIFKVQSLFFEFKLCEVCKPGNTLLWDMLQDDILNQLSEEIAAATEKIFWNTICCASNREIRFKFINGCLDNLSKNYSVITSIRLLQKLFSSFYRYQDGRITRKIIIDADRQKNMLQFFFDNLNLYMFSHSKFDQNPDLLSLKSKFYSHKEEIQIRLNFLSFIFVYAGSHENLSFSQEHVNILWKVFTTSDSPGIADEFFDWLLNQVKINNGLNLEIIKHILFEKIPLLIPESFSLTSLELLQHLHSFILSKNCENLNTCNIVINLLWNIAFKNQNNEVSMNAIRHLNHYYINLLNFTNKFDKEEEFIQQCMRNLKDASILLPIDCDKSLIIIERAVILIKTHLEAFYGRYSYFFRKMKLTSDVDLTMHTIRDKSEHVIRIMVNSPYNDKTTFEFSNQDYIGDLKAEIHCWWSSLLSKNEPNKDYNSETMICLVLRDHEIPFEYDEKKLTELGFKELPFNSNLISFNTLKHSISKTFDHCLFSNEFFNAFKLKNPKNLLLESRYFELLFTLMQQLDMINITNIKARILSRNIWEIIQMLSTSTDVLNNFNSLVSQSIEIDKQNDNFKREEMILDCRSIYEKLFPSNSNQKLIYSFQIVEYFRKNNKFWPHIFIETGGLKFVYMLLIEEIDAVKYIRDWTEWKQDCLALLIQILYQFSVYKSENINKTDNDKNSEMNPFPVNEAIRKNKRSRKNSFERNMILQFNPKIHQMIADKEKFLKVILSMLNYVSCNSKLIYQTSIWSRSQVVNFTLTFFISWCYSDLSVLDLFFKQENTKVVVKKLILDGSDYIVRRESCLSFTRLCLASTLEGINLHTYIPQFLKLLLNFIDDALIVNIPQNVGQTNEVKDFSVSGSKDFFALVCRLVEHYFTQNDVDKSDIDINNLCNLMVDSILKRKNYETRKNTTEDEGLRGLLLLLAVLIKYNPSFKSKLECKEFIIEIFKSLFLLPNQTQRELPKFKSVCTRSSAFDLLLELVKGSEDNYILLTNLLIDQHRHEIIGRTTAYPWEYWPHDDSRSECGFVGLTNLGATCYMASCMQHLFMLPEARNVILMTNLSSVMKHESILKELQKMFIFLQESERKAYNPKNFCKVYTMDHQPLNICEQKDMTEFFTDLITKLEDMTIDLKDIVKKHFSGSLSNNVVSLDCPHISQTTEEFYTLRCQVADMRDLYESLNELTIKDTLEGDNMYNCSKCGKKVRAEKRACIKKLPKILCFNTMRYTFNMITMSKEKVNTHFSFPFELDVAPYLEKNLININDLHNEELKTKVSDDLTSTKYDLIGVTVHTGTADGGHYYSFIQDRDQQSLTKDKWFLFNDAEVKLFDKEHIPAECFGGEVTSKTYDQANDKFLDFSFEKTNSAYMLFYERNDGQKPEEKCMTNQILSEGISKDLLVWIWNDNMSFLRDRFIFEHNYFDFIWYVCAQLPQTLPSNFLNKSTLIATRLATLFVLETLIHAKEKPTIASWIELLTKQFNNSQQACEWLMDHLSENDWWSIQILFKCSNQMVRQLFVRLCIHVIVKLKPLHSPLYLHPLHQHLNDGDIKSSIGHYSCVTRFIRRLISLINIDIMNTKPNIKYLTEYFSFLLEFSKQGDEECKFLLSIEAISTIVNFYLNHGKLSNEIVDSFSDNEDDDFDERSHVFGPIVEDKYPKLASLDKMITLIVYLIEKTQTKDSIMMLSKRDFDSLISGKTFLFIQQQIRDNINLRQTFNLIYAVCRLDDSLSSPIINMIFSSIIHIPECSVSFFKILSFISETNWISSYFSKLIFSKIWEIAEHTPLQTLDWLIQHVSQNKIIHDYVLSSVDQWVTYFLIENSNIRVRSNAAQLLVSLVPSAENSFRQNYRPFRSFPYSISKEIILTPEGSTIIDKLFTYLMTLIKKLKNFSDPQLHGTQKLTNYFFVTSYFLINSKQKRLFNAHFNDFWCLFQSKLSEPAIPIHQNKQAFLMFWYLACQENSECIKFIVQNTQVYKKIAFNYILADHEDQDVILFNKNMLPYYYGLLRLCCQYSRSFTRYLALHQNIQWAFKNITPYINHYQLAVQELFKLMKIFTTIHPDSNEQEIKDVANFKKLTMKMYMNNLDPNVHWATLISVLSILIDSHDDLVYIIRNNGLYLLFQSFCALHVMFHQATACHITNEIVELLKIISSLLNVFETQAGNPELVEYQSNLKEFVDIKKMIFLLNTYTPSHLRNALFEVLSKLIHVLPNQFITSISQFLLMQHILFVEQNFPFTNGPYFPKRGQKVYQTKSSLRPTRQVFQMCFNVTNLEMSPSKDQEYENLVYDFYLPYYSFVDDMCRFSIKNNIIINEMIELTIKIACESLYFHCKTFVHFWLELHHSVDHQDLSQFFINYLQNSKSFKEYITLILIKERHFLSDDKVFEFMSIYLLKLSKQVITPNMMKQALNLIDAFCLTSNWPDLQVTKQIIGDMRAVQLICMIRVFDNQNDVIIKFCDRLQKLKANYSNQLEIECRSSIEEKIPPNKRIKIDSDEKIDKEINKSDSSIESELNESTSTLNECDNSEPVTNHVKLLNVIDSIISLIKS